MMVGNGQGEGDTEIDRDSSLPQDIGWKPFPSKLRAPPGSQTDRQCDPVSALTNYEPLASPLDERVFLVDPCCCCDVRLRWLVSSVIYRMKSVANNHAEGERWKPVAISEKVRRRQLQRRNGQDESVELVTCRRDET